MMTIRGDSNKPKGLLQKEQLAGQPSTQDASARPGLRSFMAFPDAKPASSSAVAPPPPTAASQLSLGSLVASTPTASATQVAARALLQGTACEGADKPAPAPHLSFFAPTLTSLLIRIRSQLELHPQQLMAVNPSRRDAICQYLELLAGSSPVQPNAGAPALSSTDKLRAWTDWRSLGPSHQRAILVFFEELGLFALAQAILLKAWSDRGIRKWKREDLSDLNAALNGALRPLVPMDRDGWQVNRQNIYSWFKPPHEIQEALWNEFSAWRIVDEGPELLVGLIEACRQSRPERARPKGFDEKVYASLWRHTPEPVQAPGLPRKRIGFSPTLRDGSLVRKGPTDCAWYGWENSAFSLYIGELSLLWWGPSAPPFFGVGNGLETSIQPQLSLNMPFTGRPAVSQKIQEMEACDVAWIQEELVIRGHQRSLEAQLFREVLEGNASLRRLRTGGTSLGHLQACMAIAKLRPGGVLWWIRQEPLQAADGSEALQFLLDRGKLVAEWDFSGVSLGFPPTDKPALPRYVYLFQRETSVQLRHDHHPTRIWAKGSIRSHIEIQPLLDEALQLAFVEAETHPRPSTKLSCQLISQRHPQNQREWADHWPEASETDEIAEVQALRRNAQPLASLATIRGGACGNEARRMTENGAGFPSWRPQPRGFILRAHFDGKTRYLKTEPLPNPALGQAPMTTTATDPDSFTLVLSDEAFVAPLRCYLESEIVRNWLNHKATRKNQRWVLQEQDLRILPVPNSLLQQLGQIPGTLGTSFALPLPGRWETLAANLRLAPQNVRQALSVLEHDDSGIAIRCGLFVRASRITQELRAIQSQTESYVRPDGQIIWRALVRNFSPTDFVPPTLHSGVSIQGQMPLHTPITHLSTSKAPQAILLVTEAGHQVRIEVPDRFLFDILWDQIQALEKPTWSEIVEFVRAPRRLEQFESYAADLLRVYGEQLSVLEHLSAILADTAQALVRSSGAC
jgi:hypothetical protein